MRRIRILSDGPDVVGSRIVDADTGEDLTQLLPFTGVKIVGRVGTTWRVQLEVMVEAGVDLVAELEAPAEPNAWRSLRGKGQA